MGATTPRPAAGGTPQPPSSGQTLQQGSDYYRHLLDNQKEQVANVPATQQAQGQPQTPPNRPGPTPPGFGGQQQGQAGQGDNRFQGAYDAYMQRFGGTQTPPPAAQPNQPFTLPGQASQTPADTNAFNQQGPRKSNRPGVRMGAGYAGRD
jgi:hypothetical protein